MVERVAKEVQGVFHPPRQLRQVLSQAQAGDSEENTVHGRHHPHEGSTQDHIHQLRESTAAREGRILPRSPKTSGEKGLCCDPRRASLGSAQPPSQPVELAGEQGEGEPEDCTGHLG